MHMPFHSTSNIPYTFYIQDPLELAEELYQKWSEMFVTWKWLHVKELTYL